MCPDEIYLASFPFGGGAGMKLRPVLLLTGPAGNVPETLVAYISSVIPSSLLPTDLMLDPALAKYRLQWQQRMKPIDVSRHGRIAWRGGPLGEPS